MGHLDQRGDDHPLKAVHNAILNCIVIRVGYDGSLVLSDQSEAEDLVVQLQKAIVEQERHEGKQLLRDEQGVRAAAEIREAL